MKSNSFVDNLLIFDCLRSIVYQSGGGMGEDTTSNTP